MTNSERDEVFHGKFRFQILAPKEVPAHYAEFFNDNEQCSVVYTTEHCEQHINVDVNDDTIYFEYLGGSHGDELFGIKMKIYHGNDIALGETYRVDIPSAPKSPVLGEALR